MRYNKKTLWDNTMIWYTNFAMIPLKLHIKNFLSYGSAVQIIDFEQHHLICLSGKNGHGKSALLDAFTWALWGQARKITGGNKSDDLLLKIGEKHMFVIAELLVNGTHYRIRREYSLTGHKALTVLDFGIIDSRTETLKSLTEKTIRHTQEKIIQTIGFDFETFINSAFLRQGQSNEFSKKTPKERKDILATILGLDRFDLLRQKAQEQVRRLHHDKDLLVLQSEQFLQQAILFDEIIVQAQEVDNSIQKIDATQAQLVQEYQAIIKKLENYKQQETELNIIQTQLKQLEEQHHNRSKELNNYSIEWRSNHHSICRITTTFDEQEFSQLNQQLIQLQQAKNQHQQLHTQLLQLGQSVQHRTFELKELAIQKKHELDKQKNSIENDIHRLEQEAKLTYNKQNSSAQELQQKNDHLLSLTQKIDHLHITCQQLQEKVVYGEKLSSYVQLWKTRLQTIQQQVDLLQQRMDLISSISNPRCTLCEQGLTQEAHSALVFKLQNETANYTHKKKRLVTILEMAEQKIASCVIQKQQLEATNQLLQIEHNKKQHLEYQHQQFQDQLIELQLATEKNSKLISELHTKNKGIEHELSQLRQQYLEQLKTDPLLVEYNQHITAYTQQLNELNYSETEHQNIELKHQALLKLKEQFITLQQQKMSQLQRKTVIAQVISQLRAIKNERTLLQEKIKNLTKNLPELPILTHKEREISTNIHILQEQKQQLMLKKGALEQQLQTILASKERIQQIEQKKSVLLQEIEDYTAIAQASSKDGIQALLIEQALPEIEREANYLLSKLTDNQTQLMIESLRDLKSGTTKETLDIKISDTLGIRSYELFSGGEAFRIDLGLRIALSKVLARRAGTTLQTLIIDEGFGSQDEDGLARIMEALYKIQDDFAKIIVVSHLATMKEQFPTQFMIHKNPSGSTVQVITQG